MLQILPTFTSVEIIRANKIHPVYLLSLYQSSIKRKQDKYMQTIN